MASSEDITHQAISAYFIGPRCENLTEFRRNLTTLLDELQLARAEYFPQDLQEGYNFIPESIKSSHEFRRVTSRVANAVQQTARMLAEHSIPFWSPRYQAHMCTDLSMSAMLGYFMTMIYNPNNVALEASPISTVAEIEVGEQLCELFGFRNQETKGGEGPVGWGHVTCDGTVANLESMWVARNLKFYPLSIRKAMDDPDGPLRFVSDTFRVRTCQGKLKPFRDLTTWELLNLRPKTILDIPEQLHDQFGITPTWLQEALDRYNIQTIGKDSLEKHFKMQESPAYLLSATKHYSWPKAGAIMGLGSANIINIPVDHSARVDISQLEEQLTRCLRDERPVFAVVGIIGSTEEGAVDPLRQILALRQRFHAYGMSFVVHADAAWGGYFATMLPSSSEKEEGEAEKTARVSGRDGGEDGLVPDLCLRVETQQDLWAMRYCDSITVDPHKAGYIPYPAGSLVYRDGRIKNLVTWTSPYLSRGSVTTSIGVYGVEGSKPGAAAMATWLSNQCIGLNQMGYGALLSEACFTSARFSALWAALATPTDSFICVPFNALPSEASGDPKQIEAEKQRIRDEVLSQTNAEIVSRDQGKPVAEKTMTLLRALGSDTNINAFALNWRYPDGTINTDVEEANYLMGRVISRLSIESPDDKPSTIPLYLTSTEFSPKDYGDCAANFKRRLGLESNTAEDLMVLRNVVMSPFASLSSRGDFINMLGQTFKEIVEEEVEVCRARNESSPDYHSFWTHGTSGEEIFLSYRSMFHIAKHRRQIILGVEFGDLGATVYRQLKRNTDEQLVIKTSDKLDLAALLETVGRGGSAEFLGNLTTATNGIILPRIPITIKRIVKSRPLTSSTHDSEYPSGAMPFYLYGGSGDSGSGEYHIDHILTRSPNIILSAGDISLNLNGGVSIDSVLSCSSKKGGAILSLEGVHEAAMQPFSIPLTTTTTGNELPRDFFFQAGKKFEVKIWEDPLGPEETAQGLIRKVFSFPPIATGSITLGEEIVVDTDKLNRDPWGEKKRDSTVVSRWRERFKLVGKELDREEKTKASALKEEEEKKAAEKNKVEVEVEVETPMVIWKAVPPAGDADEDDSGVVVVVPNGSGQGTGTGTGTGRGWTSVPTTWSNVGITSNGGIVGDGPSNGPGQVTAPSNGVGIPAGLGQATVPTNGAGAPTNGKATNVPGIAVQLGGKAGLTTPRVQIPVPGQGQGQGQGSDESHGHGRSGNGVGIQVQGGLGLGGFRGMGKF